MTCIQFGLFPASHKQHLKVHEIGRREEGKSPPLETNLWHLTHVCLCSALGNWERGSVLDIGMAINKTMLLFLIGYRSLRYGQSIEIRLKRQYLGFPKTSIEESRENH